VVDRAGRPGAYSTGPSGSTTAPLDTDEVDLLAPRTPQRGAWHFSIGQLF
jgi:hypothetical protein